MKPVQYFTGFTFCAFPEIVTANGTCTGILNLFSMLYIPVKNFTVMLDQYHDFLGCTSTKQGIKRVMLKDSIQ